MLTGVGSGSLHGQTFYCTSHRRTVLYKWWNGKIQIWEISTKNRNWIKTNVSRYAIASNALRVRVALRTFFHISHRSRRRPVTECPVAWTNDDGAGDAGAGQNLNGRRPRLPPMHSVHPVAETVTSGCGNEVNPHGRWVPRNWRRWRHRRSVPMAADLGGMQRPPTMGTYGTTDDGVTYFDRKSWADSWQRPKWTTPYHETSRTIDLSLVILQ